MRIYNFLLLVTVLGLFSCGLSQKSALLENNSSLLNNSILNLIDINIPGTIINAEMNQFSLNFNNLNQTFSVNTDCNGLGGEYAITNNSIKFITGASTMRACDSMEIEHGMRNVLKHSSKYSISNDTFILRDLKNQTLATFKIIKRMDNAIDGNWELAYITGPRIAFKGLYPDKVPTLIIDTNTSKIHGNGTCNNYKSTIQVNGNQIELGLIGATKIACERMDAESLYFEMLRKVTHYQIIDNKLELLQNNIVLLRFIRK